MPHLPHYLARIAWGPWAPPKHARPPPFTHPPSTLTRQPPLRGTLCRVCHILSPVSHGDLGPATPPKHARPPPFTHPAQHTHKAAAPQGHTVPCLPHPLARIAWGPWARHPPPNTQDRHPLPTHPAHSQGSRPSGAHCAASATSSRPYRMGTLGPPANSTATAEAIWYRSAYDTLGWRCLMGSMRSTAACRPAAVHCQQQLCVGSSGSLWAEAERTRSLTCQHTTGPHEQATGNEYTHTRQVPQRTSRLYLQPLHTPPALAPCLISGLSRILPVAPPCWGQGPVTSCRIEGKRSRQVRRWLCKSCRRNRNTNRSYSAFALPVEASLIGPPTPHISALKAPVLAAAAGGQQDQLVELLKDFDAEPSSQLISPFFCQVWGGGPHRLATRNSRVNPTARGPRQSLRR